MDDNEDPVELLNQLIADIDNDIIEIKRRGSAYDERMEFLLSGAARQDKDMNEPIKVEEAIFMPELGGYLAVNPEHSVPSQTHAVKTLRSAIAAGKLAVEKPNSKNHVLTRKFLQEWRESCQEQSNQPDLSSGKPAAMHPVKSRIKRNGASTTTERKLTQDAARATLNSLKKR